MLINADMLATDPPAYLVDGLFPLVGQGFVYGPRHWGKSLLIGQELALAVANGVPFLGRETKQGSVALCLGEGLYDAGVRKQGRLIREQQDRTARAAAMGADGPAWVAAQPPYTDEWLFVMTEPFEIPVGAGRAHTESMRQALQQLKKLPDLALVILDSFNDFTGSLSISHNTSANRAVQGMKDMVRELDCLVLAVAHPTERGDKMLGAGRLANAADFILAIRPDEDAGPDDPKSATVSSEKNKAGEPFEPFGYVIEGVAWHEPARDENGNEIPGAPPELVKTATIRLREDEAAGKGGLRLPDLRRAAPREYPELRLPEAVTLPGKPRKRNGIKRNGQFRVITRAEAADPGRAELAAKIITVQCPVCEEGRPGKGCNPGVPAERGKIMLGRQPLIVAHTDRAGKAVANGTVTEDEVLARFGNDALVPGTAAQQAPEQVPA